MGRSFPHPHSLLFTCPSWFSFSVIIRTFHAVLIIAGFTQRSNGTQKRVILLQPNHLLSVCDNKHNTESLSHLHPIYPDEGDSQEAEAEE